jgi:hypothetical protein
MKQHAQKLREEDICGCSNGRVGHSCDWNEFTCSFAAGGGHLEVLQWGEEERMPSGDARVCEHAAERGHIELLR